MKLKSIEHRAKSKVNGGFTILELLIATAVFSVVLLLCATAIVQVGRTFYKGVTINRVQDAARKTTEDIAQSIQFGAGELKTGSQTYGGVNAQAYCIGEVRYSYVTDRAVGTGTVNKSTHVLWKDRVSSTATCSPVDLTATSPSLDGQEILGDNMRIPVFLISPPPVGTTNQSWRILVTVSYGDDPELFVGGNFTECISQNSGGQYCAVSIIITNATQRL